MNNTFPLFVVEDINEISQFFVTHFNFNIVFESDWYNQLQNETSQLGFMIKNSANQPDFLHAPFAGVGAIITVEVKDVHSYFEKMSGLKIIHTLTQEEWGQTHFMVQGPQNIIVDVVNETNPEDY